MAVALADDGAVVRAPQHQRPHLDAAVGPDPDRVGPLLGETVPASVSVGERARRIVERLAVEVGVIRRVVGAHPAERGVVTDIGEREAEARVAGEVPALLALHVPLVHLARAEIREVRIDEEQGVTARAARRAHDPPVRAPVVVTLRLGAREAELLVSHAARPDEAALVVVVADEGQWIPRLEAGEQQRSYLGVSREVVVEPRHEPVAQRPSAAIKPAVLLAGEAWNLERAIEPIPGDGIRAIHLRRPPQRLDVVALDTREVVLGLRIGEPEGRARVGAGPDVRDAPSVPVDRGLAGEARWHGRLRMPHPAEEGEQQRGDEPRAKLRCCQH